ncbi:MAG: AzlD domain-containing protein [Burkholderiaceae bacterium]
MISRLDLIVLLCGVGTFLLRFLPMWQARWKPSASTSSGPLYRLFQGIGPAAITALLVVSLWPTLVTNFHPASALGTCLALLVILIIKRLRGGIAAPTLAGAIIYGLFMHRFGA